MIVYQTDDEGYFVGQTEAEADPMTPGAFLLPGGCVETSPPTTGAGEVARLNGADWVVVPDLAGTKYWLQDGQEQVVAGRGEGLPVGALLSKPPKPLSEAKAEKITILESARDAATVTNVTAHGRQWQADERSQKLLSSAITLATVGAPLPAAWRDANNSNMPITTLAELVAIAGAMATQTQAAYSKSWTLKAAVDAAQTPEAVNAVVW